MFLYVSDREGELNSVVKSLLDCDFIILGFCSHHYESFVSVFGYLDRMFPLQMMHRSLVRGLFPRCQCEYEVLFFVAKENSG